MAFPGSVFNWRVVFVQVNSNLGKSIKTNVMKRNRVNHSKIFIKKTEIGTSHMILILDITDDSSSQLSKTMTIKTNFDSV